MLLIDKLEKEVRGISGIPQLSHLEPIAVLLYTANGRLFFQDKIANQKCMNCYSQCSGEALISVMFA